MHNEFLCKHWMQIFVSALAVSQGEKTSSSTSTPSPPSNQRKSSSSSSSSPSKAPMTSPPQKKTPSPTGNSNNLPPKKKDSSQRNYNQHWLIQEAEQRRISEMQFTSRGNSLGHAPPGGPPMSSPPHDQPLYENSQNLKQQAPIYSNENLFSRGQQHQQKG